jgi:aryl carrier-like protein
VLLEALPLTPNGKIDRSALPAPDVTRALRSKKFVAPKTAQEVTMADIWASVLHLGQVGVTDDLFELGADSLHIFQIAARANKVGINVPPALLLKHRTITDLIRQIAIEPTLIATTELPQITKVARDKYRIERSSIINGFDRKNGSA